MPARTLRQQMTATLCVWMLLVLPTMVGCTPSYYPSYLPGLSGGSGGGSYDDSYEDHEDEIDPPTQEEDNEPDFGFDDDEGPDPGAIDGGTLSVGGYDANGGTTSLSSDGTGTINSEELSRTLSVEVVNQQGQPVPGLRADWIAHDGNVAVIVYDPAGEYAAAMYVGNPVRDAAAGNAMLRSAPHDSKIAVTAIVGGVLLAITVIQIGMAEVDYILDTYRMAEFSITNIAAVHDDYGVFRCTVEEAAAYLAANYGTKKATLSIATSLTTSIAGGLSSSLGWNIFTTAIGQTTTAQTDLLLDLLNDVENYSLYGHATPDTEIYVAIYNWESVGEFFHDVHVQVLPIGWDDGYEHNDSFSTAATLNGETENLLVCHDNDPDYYKVYLNPGDSFDATASFLNARGDINLFLYDPNENEIDSSESASAFEESVSVSDVSTPGWYYVVVENDGGEWSSNVYNLELSSVGGEVPQGQGELRFVLTWGALPTDLDSHLWTPDVNGDEYHIYYANRMSPDSTPYAGLDVDDVTSYGPETITISELYPGTYYYSVYNYSGSPALTTSDAQITAYDEFGLIGTYDIPTSGSGRWWHVFQIDGTSGQITFVNEINSTPAKAFTMPKSK